MTPADGVRVDGKVPVPMRDGVVLRADVYRPAASGRYPVLLCRTPYGKARAAASYLNPVNAAFQGYVVVIQDVRGRFESEGEFTFFHHERADGYDSVEWCAAQPWSNGRVGMYGGSYLGVTQWQAAMARPPALRAIAPGTTEGDYHDGWTYDGGAFQLGFNLSWVLLTAHQDATGRPGVARYAAQLGAMFEGVLEVARQRPLTGAPLLQEIPAGRSYLEWLAHPDDCAYWRRLSVAGHYGEIDVPSLNLGGWYDLFSRGPLRNFVGMRTQGATTAARTGTKLIVGPWDHGTEFGFRAGHRRFAGRAQLLTEPLLLRWFDYWLKDADTGIAGEPPVRLFVMGADEWRAYASWPPPDVRYEPLYLHSGGGANGLDGDGVLSVTEPGAEPPDHFVYDPTNPVPSIGGIWNLADGLAGGSFDQRAVEQRDDVLVYTSEPLREPCDIIGPVSLVLWAETDAPDTDWTAKLVDVAPDGTAWNICDGIVRARYRQAYSKPALIGPGAPLEYAIDMRATAYRFHAGHRLRLEVSSSNFPRFDPNPNTGTVVAYETAHRRASQVVYHSGRYPSRLILPLVLS